MTGVVGNEGSPFVQVVIGVDTHQDHHVAVAIDHQGVRLAERYAPATRAGTARWNGGPGIWERFAPSGSKARAPTALDSLVS